MISFISNLRIFIVGTAAMFGRTPKYISLAPAGSALLPAISQLVGCNPPMPVLRFIKLSILSTIVLLPFYVILYIYFLTNFQNDVNCCESACTV